MSQQPRREVPQSESAKTAIRMFVREVMPLLGNSVALLDPGDETGAPAGGDVDCAVVDLDQLWPLRAGERWRLCQCLWYDLTGWYWVLERGERFLAIDTLDDRLGIGRYGLPTGTRNDSMSSSGIRAAYLTAKRVRKAGRWAKAYERARPIMNEWSRIRTLAMEDVVRFRETLDMIFGRRLADELAACALSGMPPGRKLVLMSRTTLLVRRFRSPTRVLTGLHLAARRWLTRASVPTGMVVAIVGPDGSGKSTLARSLPEAVRGPFRRDVHIHWRPQVLPRPGALFGRAVRDASNPHDRPPHGPVLSHVLLAYYWIDFMLGGLVKLWPMTMRSSLVVIERGWTDIAVDPRRYQLTVRPSLIRALGKLLPQPSLILCLETRPEAVATRKAELAEDEFRRQVREWRDLLAANRRSVFLDAAHEPHELVYRARDTIIRHLEARAVSRVGSGWANLPASNVRWWIPRGPARVAASALRIHQPMRPSARLIWEGSRLAARVGLLAFARRGAAPPRAVRQALAPILPRGATFACGRANHQGRFFASIIDGHGRCIAWAKIATTKRGRAALLREAKMLSALSPLLEAPLRAPRVLDRTDDVLVFDPLPWTTRSRPWELPEVVADAIGRFFSAGKDGKGHGLSHGDFAPWNLLRTNDGWALVDWEEATKAGSPFADLFHYVVQGYSLLGRPSGREVLDAISGEGPLGASIIAYVRSADLDLGDAPGAFRSYLDLSRLTLDATTHDGIRGREARSQLLERLGPIR